MSRQVVNGEKATIARFSVKKDYVIRRHAHPNEEYMLVTSGRMRYQLEDRELEVKANDVLIVPADVPHAIRVLEDTTFLVFFAPVREDWLRGEDQYLRHS
ncbi:MAG: cupin domain-containing protein [Pontibacter sp.]|nr:cupin domain-containing protein [Pontibacter sp.]